MDIEQLKAEIVTLTAQIETFATAEKGHVDEIAVLTAQVEGMTETASTQTTELEAAKAETVTVTEANAVLKTDLEASIAKVANLEATKETVSQAAARIAANNGGIDGTIDVKTKETGTSLLAQYRALEGDAKKAFRQENRAKLSKEIADARK